MPGRPRKVYDPTDPSVQGKLRPRKRADISTVSNSEDCRRFKAMATWIQHLIDLETTHGAISSTDIAQAAFELDIPPYKVVNAIHHFKAYHAVYKNEDPANAFTPLLQIRGTSSRVQHDEEKVSSDRPLGQIKKPRRRPHISTILEPAYTKIIVYASRINELRETQARNANRLPDGELSSVAIELGVKETTLSKHLEQLKEYLAAYPDEPPANAFTPLPKGRPKGRSASNAVREAIEKAYVNKKWPTDNTNGTTSEIDQALGPNLIHSFVTQTFPSYTRSHWTTRRIINDYRNEHMAEAEALRDDKSVLQNVLPWIDNKVSGCWERVQVDIRDLPWVVNYNGIHCTVRAVLFVEDYSDFVPVWHLLPSKRMDNNEEVKIVNYTCQKIRELTAVLLLRAQKRFRILYPDNGSQFMKPALGPYMQFLVAPEEEPSVLINRGRKKPRGGGNVENLLGQLNAFLELRPGYINEKNYRKSYKRLQKVSPPKFEDAANDFDTFMNSWNYDRVDGKPSCFDKLMSGPDLSLSLPSEQNLAVFSFTNRLEKRKADPGGFNIDGKPYVAFRDDPRIYQALANAALASKDIPVLIAELGEYKMVRFSLDGGITYELAVPKDQKGTTQDTQTKLLQSVDQAIDQLGSEAAALIKTLLESTEKPLVLSGLRKQRRFKQHDGQPYTVDENDPTRSQGPQYKMPRNVLEGSAEEAPSTNDDNRVAKSGKAAKQRDNQANKKRKSEESNKRQQAPRPQEQEDQQSSQAWGTANPVPASPAPPDDTEDFLRELRAELDSDHLE